MQIDELRTAIQSSLDQDFDTLYAEFVSETGNRDAAAFVEHIHGFGLISDQLYRDVIAGGTLAPSRKSKTPAPPPPPGVQTAPVTDGTPAPAARAAPPAASPPEETEEPEEEEEPVNPYRRPKRKTAFRRTTGGALRETGAMSTPDIAERRKKRRRTGARASSSGEARASRRKKRRQKLPESADGRYKFIKTVGEGAMGRVHLAEDTTLHRKVAYKAMSEEIARQATLASKFTAEAQITAQLDHPNIVPVYSLENEASYTMKLVNGKTFEDIIAEATEQAMTTGRLDSEHDLDAVIDLFLRVCDAIEYAHSRGVVHRDLKPENIMVGAFNAVYVMDWGISRLMNHEVAEPVALGAPMESEGDLVIGTPGYMSPEQAEGFNEDLTGASDQYSLGLILFELIALKPAVTGKTAIKLVMRHQDGEKDPLTHLKGWKIPRELAAIVHKATAKDGAHRYDSVNDLAEDIKRFRRGDAVHAKPDNLVQATARWGRAHFGWVVTAAAMSILSALLVVALVVGVALWSNQQRKAAEQVRTTLMTTAARQSSLIDGQFLKYEGLLSLIATTATDLATRPQYDERAVFLSPQFASAETGPADLAESKRYGLAVSLENPVFVTAPGARPERLRLERLRLAPMQKHFYKSMLRSHSEAAAHYTPKRARRALTDVGVPIAWTYIGFENGLYATFPGHGNFAEDFDHRTHPWYELAKGSRGPKWGAPSPDSSGLGLVLSCVQALYDDEDAFMGVAGVDVTFDYIIEELLEAPEFKEIEGSEAFLLDADGNVVVRSSKRGKSVTSGASSNRLIRMPPFHNEDVLEAIEEHRSGWLAGSGTDGQELILYNRMNSIGWYYVVTGPEKAMLNGG